MCGVTQYPNSTSDPEELFKISLRVASDALSKLSSLADSITTPPNDKRLEAAVIDCKELFDDSADRLQDSISSMIPGDPNVKMLTTANINDLRTWLSVAIADQEKCLDGFEGTMREDSRRR